jgi:Kef-type K+ transport system membrane component KefB
VPPSFADLSGVALIAFVAPLILGLVPWLRVPAVVVEILAGIVVGPSVLGWLRVDLSIQVLATLGLAFLLFLAGQEIDFTALRGRTGWIAGAAFLLSLVLAAVAGFAGQAAGLVQSGLFVAVVLVATSLGLVLAVLEDAGIASTQFGQLVIAASALADFGAVILLALFFTRGQGSPLVTATLLVAFALAVGLAALTIIRAKRFGALSRLLRQLQDTTAQIRVRGAVLLLLAFAALAARFGIEVLLASFMAGAVLTSIDRDGAMTHPQFRGKLEAIGNGFLIPVFFVASGLQFDLRSLLAYPAGLLEIPLFLIAMLVTRALPAAVYVRDLAWTRSAAAGLLQATSLPFIVAATQIGTSLGLVKPSLAAAMVAAGLLSVVAFPALALVLARLPGDRVGHDVGRDTAPGPPPARAEESRR